MAEPVVRVEEQERGCFANITLMGVAAPENSQAHYGRQAAPKLKDDELSKQEDVALTEDDREAIEVVSDETAVATKWSNRGSDLLRGSNFEGGVAVVESVSSAGGSELHAKTKKHGIDGARFAFTGLLMQVGIVILFATTVEFPKDVSITTAADEAYITNTFFSDSHLYMVMGLGGLGMYLYRYGFSCLSLNLLIISLALQVRMSGPDPSPFLTMKWELVPMTLSLSRVRAWVQWGTVVTSFFHAVFVGSFHPLQLSLVEFIKIEQVAGAVIVSHGAFMGKVGPLQVILICFIEIFFAVFNE
jgi:hypothetical protein